MTTHSFLPPVEEKRLKSLVGMFCLFVLGFVFYFSEGLFHCVHRTLPPSTFLSCAVGRCESQLLRTEPNSAAAASALRRARSQPEGLIEHSLFPSLGLPLPFSPLSMAALCAFDA